MVTSDPNSLMCVLRAAACVVACVVAWVRAALRQRQTACRRGGPDRSRPAAKRQRRRLHARSSGIRRSCPYSTRCSPHAARPACAPLRRTRHVGARSSGGTLDRGGPFRTSGVRRHGRAEAAERSVLGAGIAARESSLLRRLSSSCRQHSTAQRVLSEAALQGPGRARPCARAHDSGEYVRRAIEWRRV